MRERRPRSPTGTRLAQPPLLAPAACLCLQPPPPPSLPLLPRRRPRTRAPLSRTAGLHHAGPRPVPEPAPPPPRECRRPLRLQRQLPAPAALSAGCHLGRAGDGEGAGPAGEGGALMPARGRGILWRAGCPACGLEAESAGLPAGGDAAAPACNSAYGAGRRGGRDPPLLALGEGAGGGAEHSHWSEAGCPAPRTRQDHSLSASAGYYNPGFPGATGMRRGSEHMAPPSIPGMPRPLFLDPWYFQIFVPETWWGG